MIWTRVSNRNIGRLRRASMTLDRLLPHLIRITMCVLAGSIIAAPFHSERSLAIFRLALAIALVAFAVLQLVATIVYGSTTDELDRRIAQRQ